MNLLAAATETSSHVDPYWVWLVLKLGAISAAVGAVYKFIYRPLMLLVKRVSEFIDQVNYITKELKPNGGSSLKDTINRICQIVEKLDQRQRSLCQFDPSAIFELDRTGGCLWANNSFLDLTGRHTEDITGMGWLNVVAEEDRGRVSREWQQCVRHNRDFATQFNVRTPDRTIIPVDIRALHMVTSDSDLMGYMACLTPQKGKHPKVELIESIEKAREEAMSQVEKSG